MVLNSDAVVQPGAVVVESFNALVAHAAVSAAFSSDGETVRT